MRLICPNCDAQYEVDDAAIPAAGRDVQCSSCGHGWFQSHPEADAERAAESALHDAPVAEAAIDPTPEVAAMPDADAQVVVDGPDDVLADAMDETVSEISPDAIPRAALDTVAETAAEAVAESDAETPATAVAEVMQQSRQIDEAVLTVLREEAEREMIARRLDAEPTVETQTDLGIDDAAAVAASTAASARHIALLKGEDPDAEPEAKRELTRREMLPDIEEINSSLRPGDVAVDDDGETFEIVQRPAPRSGFRSGFVLMLVLAIAVVALYVMAPRISELIPGAKPALDAFVAGVDAARAWLDTATRGVVESLQGLAGGDTPPTP